MVKKIGGCRFKRTAAASWFEEGVLIKSSYYGDVVIDLDGEEVNDIHSFGPAPKFLSNKLTWLIFNIRSGGLKLKNYRF